MSYLVLARKWRPKRFSELVGQEHVVRALVNALDSGRVHHAFLFSGTRGVGKTTIARIFAKSLNCERGQGADPCGECAACLDIDAGRFVDLLEIDAASHTGIDDVRQLIENAQYMPSRGRTKVYLIDEVHMLSKPAFNALLKTLEEPPDYVKFLLATTDPEKLPVTVLSRCLQFNLKRLDLAQIGGQMRQILTAEQLPIIDASIELLARGADGSLRDGLSLLDQAIAYTAGTLDESGVRAMLGSVDRARVGALLGALADGDGLALRQEVEALVGFAPDFAQVLDEIAATLHRIQLKQLVPGVDDDSGIDTVALAERLPAEVVQLWYQMAIGGRRDLPLAPSPRAGFEMALLRMLAFRPAAADTAHQASGGSRLVPPRSPAVSTSSARSATDTAPAAVVKATQPKETRARPSPRVAEPRAAERPVASQARVHPVPPRASATNDVVSSGIRTADVADESVPEKSAAANAKSAMPMPETSDDWLALLEAADLRGPVRELAANAIFQSSSNDELQLALAAEMSHLRSDASRLSQGLAGVLGKPPKISIVSTTGGEGETLHVRNSRRREQRQSEAEQSFMDESAVQRYMQQYGAKLVPGSIRPMDET
ncbi:MAG: DNA polymerase III subunit gamma/tau [Lysobacteraceae bacterium]